MKRLMACAALAGSLLVVGPALGQGEEPTPPTDHEAGVPLAPNEAAGVWALENNGRALCHMTLSAHKTSGGAYGVKPDAACQGDLPAMPVAWAPTNHGMKLLGADGQTIITMGRWSNSLFVAPQSTGGNLQLRRAG
jgi:hypothetical protein